MTWISDWWDLHFCFGDLKIHVLIHRDVAVQVKEIFRRSTWAVCAWDLLSSSVPVQIQIWWLLIAKRIHYHAIIPRSVSTSCVIPERWWRGQHVRSQITHTPCRLPKSATRASNISHFLRSKYIMEMPEPVLWVSPNASNLQHRKFVGRSKLVSPQTSSDRRLCKVGLGEVLGWWGWDIKTK